MNAILSKEQAYKYADQITEREEALGAGNPFALSFAEELRWIADNAQSVVVDADLLREALSPSAMACSI